MSVKGARTRQEPYVAMKPRFGYPWNKEVVKLASREDPATVPHYLQNYVVT